jgi:hypothetical protein
VRPWGVAADRLHTNCFLANAWAVTLLAGRGVRGTPRSSARSLPRREFGGHDLQATGTQRADEHLPRARFREDVTGLEDEATTIGLQERPRVDHHMIGMDHASRKKLPLDLEWHYTPEHGSWLNVAECKLSVLEWQCLAR